MRCSRETILLQLALLATFSRVGLSVWVQLPLREPVWKGDKGPTLIWTFMSFNTMPSTGPTRSQVLGDVLHRIVGQTLLKRRLYRSWNPEGFHQFFGAVQI